MNIYINKYVPYNAKSFIDILKRAKCNKQKNKSKPYSVIDEEVSEICYTHKSDSRIKYVYHPVKDLHQNILQFVDIWNAELAKLSKTK